MKLSDLSIQDQYDYVHKNIGIIERDDVGCLEISGEDALDLLNRLSTNDLINFDYSNGSITTVLTTNKGRMIDVLTISKSFQGYFITCSLGALEEIIEWINFYTIIEDISIKNVTSEILYITLIGPNSNNILLNSSSDRIKILNIIQSKFISYDSVDVLVNIEEKNKLFEYLQNLKISNISNQIFDIIRIKEAVPIFQKEITQKFNPLEAKLEKYISFNKGCYIGQEVIARLNTYKKVKRVLVNIEWNSEIIINTGDKIVFDHKDVGIITSYVYNPGLGKYIGLAYINKGFKLQEFIVNIGVEKNIKLLITHLENSHHQL